MSKPAFSLADLQQGAKKLNTVEAPAECKQGGTQTHPAGGSKADGAGLEALESLYDKHGGDLDLLFSELKANPAKAKKPHHAPKSAREFASKFLEGYYSVIEGSADDAAAEGKTTHK